MEAPAGFAEGIVLAMVAPVGPRGGFKWHKGFLCHVPYYTMSPYILHVKLQTEMERYSFDVIDPRTEECAVLQSVGSQHGNPLHGFAVGFAHPEDLAAAPDVLDEPAPS